jgi:hypothetical protein
MERLDQVHHHSKLEVPRLTCLGQVSNSGLVVGAEQSNSYSGGTSTYEPPTVETMFKNSSFGFLTSRIGLKKRSQTSTRTVRTVQMLGMFLKRR